MVKRARLRRTPMRMLKDGKFYKDVYSPDEYERLLKRIDRRKHKVRLE